MGYKADTSLPVNDAIYDIAIIGGGPTGLFASFYAGMRNMKTLLIEAMPELGGQLTFLYPDKFIYDVPGHPKVLAKHLVENLVAQGLQFRPTVILGERVSNVVKLGEKLFMIETDKGRYYSKTIVICAGIGAISPRRLGIPEVERFEGKGLYYVVTNKWEFKDRRVMIVGGGDTAVDWALNLQNIAKKVTLIHRRGQFRAHEASVIELFHSNVEVMVPYVVKSAQGDSALRKVTVMNLDTNEEEIKEVDALIPCLGFIVDNTVLKKWGLEMEGQSLLVNGRMETNVAGIYGAGDIAHESGSVKLNLICVGFAQAAIAVNVAKNYIDPSSSYFPGHSSERRF
ncbi:MAG: NAD(P)/FAD-dependent oxidoreductase [Aigarchaeota archaeon]|nr:NAD(P)/FAD-dependent oxidoreductase [Aigarchaeota archaeon]MDW8092198.1 NAD(P)/FAD-dependent oxidoreductase [Nitrososphaerota archaeon]